MKRLFSYLLMAGVALVALSACNKELSFAKDADAPQAIELALVGDFAVQVDTRVTEVTQSGFTSGLHVTAVTGNAGSEAQVSNFSNVTFTKNGSVWKGTDKYWPETDPGYKFYGSNVDITFAAAGSYVRPSSTIADVIVGYQAGTHKQQVNMQMNHIYSRLRGLTVNAPSDGCSVSGLTVTFVPVVPGSSTQYNIRTGSWSNTANGSSQTLLSNQSIAASGSVSAANTTDVWCVPQDTYKLTFTYTLTKGSWTKTYSNVQTQNIAFVAGKRNTITATLPGAGSDIADIQIGVTVTDWQDNPITAGF